MDSIGFLVVDISVVAERKDFNQLETKVIASHSAEYSSSPRRSRLLPVNASISLEKSRARPIKIYIYHYNVKRLKSYEASDASMTSMFGHQE